jgi:RNA polymerase sigma-70 factor (ECF subfamily)
MSEPTAMPGAIAAADDQTEFYLDQRELLFALAYNLTGCVADTEDVLQDTWLAWAAAPRSEIGNPRAYLVRIAVNSALGRLRRASRAREHYLGPWLPEPVLTTPDAAESAVAGESVSLALMVVLETLTPLERAVFVLREAFAYDYTEIASLLDRTPVAVRQLAHRARQRVRARQPRREARPQAVRAVTERFLDAALGGNMDTLLEVLAPDVRLWTDGGGRRHAALRVIEGRAKVLRLIGHNLAGLPALTVRPVDVIGGPATLLVVAEEIFAVLVVELADDDRVGGIYAVLNPDKLTGVVRRRVPAARRASPASLPVDTRAAG